MDKIKKFSDFMASLGSKMRRSLNHLIIEGSVKSWFFSNPKGFELHIYYSNQKETILEIRIQSQKIKIEDLNLTFRVGDNINQAYQWIKDDGHNILADFRK